MNIRNHWFDDIWMPKGSHMLSASAGGEEGGDAGAAGGSGEEEASETPSRPDFVPEKFWDAEAGEVRLKEAFKSYGDMEKKQGAREETLRATIQQEMEESRMAARPESPDKYELQVPDDYTEIGVTIDDDDPVLQFWRSEAHELGLSNEQFNATVTKYLDHSIKNAPDPQVEMKKLGDTGRVRVQALGRWAERNFQGEELAAIHRMTTTADGVLALERMVEMAQGDSGPPRDFGDTVGQTQLDQATLQSMQDDPRYWDPMRRDPSWVKKVEQGFEKLYGTKKM